MAFMPGFRLAIFILITLLSGVVLGLATWQEFLLGGFVDASTLFAPLAIAASILSIVTLPLFLGLGSLQGRVCTSTIVFELIWFLILCVLWATTAGIFVAESSIIWPTGCTIYDLLGNYDPQQSQYCVEYNIMEAFSFVNFACAAIYYKVILWWSIISAVRGRRIWTLSVKEAATGIIKNGGSPPIPVHQPQYIVMPPGQIPSTYPGTVPVFNGVAPQVVPQGSPPAGVPYVVLAQPYQGQMSPQSPPLQYHYVSTPGSPQFIPVSTPPVDPTAPPMPVQGHLHPQQPNLPSPYDA